VVAGYQPQNYGGGYSGWVTLQDALTRSINVVAVKVLAEVGFEPTLKVARAMGIESELGEIYPLALGAFEVTLLEMTGAYGTFANAGKHYPVHGIRRILAANGTVLFDAESDLKPAQAIDADSAAIVTAMLRQVVEAGTGRPAQLDRPVAGKTGTSDDSRDLWFIGYVPQLVVGVWLGNDDNSPTYGSSGTAARVWQMFASEALAGTAVAQFPEMPNLATRVVELEAQPEEEEAVRKARGNDNRQPQASDGDDSWGVGWRNGWSAETTAPAGSARKEIEPEPEYGTPEYFERHYDLDRPEPDVLVAPSEPAVEPEATIPPEKLIFSQDEGNDSVKY
jgi:penicillin-binding protein 1A